MTDLEHLGWAKLALACHAHDPAVADVLPKLDEQIRAALREADRPTAGRSASRAMR